MRANFGHGGWVAVDDIGIDIPLYVRVREASDGRLRISEFYLDGSQSDIGITQRAIRDLPLSNIEALINAHRDDVLCNIDAASPDLSTYATYYVTRFMNWPTHDLRSEWVAASFASQVPDELRDQGLDPVPKAPRKARSWRTAQDREFRLSRAGPEHGLTDDFLRDVARAYHASLARGERPNASMAQQTGYPLRTVQRWVYTARQRGIMPRGRRGRAG
ncbi:MAG TPA: hypothetical protein VE442_21805 [Jatrophihabitans sp.]|nr:hypothetical protein [Jatrophihabitans sp.]